ncbi:hypothetical protein NMG60_11018371 [Bertholletia excelsa]
MSLGVRHLTVLGEFKPFGLIAEALDGKPSENVDDKYDYFLFDPEHARQRDEAEDSEAASSTNRGDHELFIRRNRIIWTTGSRVYKRFSLPSQVIMACWSRLGNMSEALLCVLQTDSLTVYNTSGEVVSVPLPRTITSIWPLPFGLLLQQAAEGSSSTYAPFSSFSPSLSSRDVLRLKREVGYSPQCNFTTLDHPTGILGSSLSSLLVLRDPLEEPQSTYIEERGKLNIMKEFDERTIWTSDRVSLMASYNKGKMQHSLWVAEAVGSNLEAANSKLSDVVPVGVLPKQFSFRRIWQGKGAQTAASKVFWLLMMMLLL